jgi:drug/metabolite transporter (DMT)-like permease
MNIKGYAYLFSGMAVVGLYVALSKPLTHTFPVFLLATLRFAIAAVLMLPWLFPLIFDKNGEKRDGKSIVTKPIELAVKKTLFWQSFFGNFLFSIFMLYGVSQTSATASGVILASLPAVVAIFSWLFLRESLSPKTALAAALAFAGVITLSMAKIDVDAANSASSILGNVLVFCCVCCEAVYIILGKRLTQSLSPKRISALINLIGLALMLPLGIWQATSFQFSSVTPALWGLLVFYAVAASMLSTWLWLTGLKTVPASQSGVFTIALPIAATCVGVGFLGERLTYLHGIAFACAASGILLIAMSSRDDAK